MRVIDTNVLICHLLGQGGELTERSSALFRRLRSGEESVHLPITVLFECVYTCQSSFEVPNDVLAPILKQIVGFPGVDVEHRQALVETLDLWTTQGPLSFADCYHLALTKDLGMTEIYTFDRKMDRFPGVDRVEP